MGNAILYAGIEELNTIKEHVMELEGYQDKNEELLREEARLEKVLSSKEKDLAEEIETTLKKRRSEIESSFEGQLSTLNSRQKKIKGKKEKAKGTKVSERIAEETAELRERNQELTIEIKSWLKKDKTPRFCNSILFFSFFQPKALLEIVILIIGLLVAFLAIPCGIYALLPTKPFGDMTLALIYLVTVVVFGGIYLLMNNLIKEKHLETIKQIRLLRTEHHTNGRKIRLIRKGIKNDSDESVYGLEQYDSELKEVEEEIHKIAEEEKEALTEFESTTTATIMEEIRGRYKEELEVIRENYDKTYAEQKQTEEKVKEFTLMLSKQYESYLGKDVLNVAKLERLIGYIERGEAANIGEALTKDKEK